MYRYAAGGCEQFGPHIDAGFPPSSSTTSPDGMSLIWDATDCPTTRMEYPPGTVSRLTLLLYLNDDFEGGHTTFYHPVIETGGEFQGKVLEAVQPHSGQVLLFPQAVGEEAVEEARKLWPLHEGSPVVRGRRPKYVIRSDVLFVETKDGGSGGGGEDGGSKG